MSLNFNQSNRAKFIFIFFLFFFSFLINQFVLVLFFQIADRAKRPINSGSGDESGLPKNQDLSGLYGTVAAALTSSSLNNISDNGDYVPTVGRWGNEWPS